MAASIVEALLAAGWQPEAPRPGAQRRAARSRPDGSRLVVETRDDGLWLVVDEHGERRVIGIEPSAAPAEVAAAIVSLQDSLSINSYLEAYGALGAVGDVSIVAWEQFDPEWR